MSQGPVVSPRPVDDCRYSRTGLTQIVLVWLNRSAAKQLSRSGGTDAIRGDILDIHCRARA